MTTDLRTLFLLDPDIAFLNHGSFGACPQPVFDAYQHWQRELEREPVDFFARRVQGLFNNGTGGLLDEARARLAGYIHAPAENLAFVMNATAALNIVARSLKLQTGDEVLTGDHEYGTVDYLWAQICERAGAKLIRQSIPLPVTTHDDFVASFWSAVTPRTRLILLSHITSPTALTFPIAEICRRARAAGILTVIDGAHAVGQIALDIAAIDPDFYASNCHKWLCSPKGSAFLYVHPDQQAALEPLVLSWAAVNRGRFSDIHEMWATRDLAAFLAVPAAIDFMVQHDWDAVRQRCHAMVVDVRDQLADLTGQPLIAPEDEGWFAQMATVLLPESCDPMDVRERLRFEHQVEVAAGMWNGANFLRVSVQGYNTSDDLERLVTALKGLL